MTNRTTACVVPSMRFDDAPRAIEWLCEAFGFEEHLVVPGDDSTVTHAQLKLGNSMIMLGSTRDDEYGKLVKGPRKLGANTHGIYVIVDDIAGHFERAKAAGAEIVQELEEQHYGGHLYTCLDCEGHLWNFGSYDPWKEIV